MAIKMHNTLTTLIFIIGLSSVSFGAEPESSETTIDISTEESNIEVAVSETENISITNEENDDNAADVAIEPSNDNFVPRTQISEDLSVSFPVDI